MTERVTEVTTNVTPNPGIECSKMADLPAQRTLLIRAELCGFATPLTNLRVTLIENLDTVPTEKSC